MKSHVAEVKQATPCLLTLSALRRNLLAVIVGNPLFSEAEQLRANHNAHECQDAARLALWLKNARRVEAEREAAAKAQAPAPATLADLASPAYVAQHGQQPYAHGLTVAQAAAGLENLRQSLTGTEQPATPGQCDELYKLSKHPALTAAEKAQTLFLLPSFTQGHATAYIGKMWARVLQRNGRLPYGSTLANA